MFNNKEEKKIVQELSSSTTTISKGTVIDGNIETTGNVRVEGKIIGHIRTKSKIATDASSRIEGNIYAQNAEISGQMVGTIEVADVLVLKSTANIDGDIFTNKLVVESGAVFNGKCKMGNAPKEVKLGKHDEFKEQTLKAQ